VEREIRKIVRDIVEESVDRYVLVPYYEDSDFDEYGIDEYEAADRAEEIAKNGGVTILRGQELSALLIDSKFSKVIGGLWVSNNSDKFSFDIAIDSGYQNMGLSSKLIQAAIGEYEHQKEMYGDDFRMEVDVINPKLAQILEKKYGFHVVANITQDRVLMSIDESMSRLNEDVSIEDVGDDKGYWDRVKLTVKDKKGEEVGYAVLDMTMFPEYEFGHMDDDDPAKFSDEEIEKHFPEDLAAKLEHIEIYDSFKRRGYGKELMNAVIKFVKEKGYKTLYLIASPIGVNKIDLDALTNFYKKYGFNVVKDFGNARDMIAQLDEDYKFVRKIVREVIEESFSDSDIWYHGTPDVREIEKEGGFTQRYINIHYVEDVDEWNRRQQAMADARASGDEDGYFEILNKVGELRKNTKIRKPTYADPHRSFDYQNAEEKVLKVKTKPGKGVTINAPGSRFRFIDIEPVRRGFINAGVDQDKLDSIIAQLNFAEGTTGGIRTDDIAAIGDWLGFDYIDVKGVLDSYQGGSIKSTVRMVFDPSHIEIL
jgi:ribosomal protein S18 acetylase RimI-like enzyme